MVRPGLTGLAQVAGRTTLNWDARLDLDVHYVERCSIWLDCRILLHSVRVVVMREGIAAVGNATMPEFMGETIVASDHEAS